VGKKKVIEKSEEEILKEKESLESQLAKKSKLAVKEKIEEGRLYISSSYNNTIMTLTDKKGNVITWLSAGSLGFSGPKKATPFAASKVAEAMWEKIQKVGVKKLEVLVKGLGGGRDAAIRSLAAKEINISSLKDITPIPHNGPRPKKPRRV